jgi:CubicO group peptidase (beta-lactamase class C family)
MAKSRWARVDEVVHAALGRVFPAAVVWVQHSRRVLFQQAYGEVMCASDITTSAWEPCPTECDTVFDLASLTKLFTATAFMTLVEAGRVALDQAVVDVWPAFRGPRPIRPYPDPLNPGADIAVVPATDETVDAGQVTFRHLLTHTSGLPAWRPLYKLGSREAVVQAVLDTYFAYPTGSHVVYSDLGFILLGETVSYLADQPLASALQELVLAPLSLKSTRFRPRPSPQAGQQSSTCDRLGHGLTQPRTKSLAPAEVCTWRQRRLIGEVDDENAAGMGGVAGHAGLYSTAGDVARFGATFLGIGSALLGSETAAAMIRCQAEDGATRRGLGWQLWSADPANSGYPFSQRAFGHTGFTGTSLWVDPQRELIVACLTNRVYYGREEGEAIKRFRVTLHEAIVTVLSAVPGSDRQCG